jgi:dihydrolipoamide dehydrogenase
LSNDFDVVVIGSGPGGYVAAIHAGQAGLRTAIVEKNKTLGGTCLNVGCIPTKALLEAAHLLDKIGESKKFGIKVSGVEADWGGVQKYRSKVVRQNTGGVAYLMRKNNVEVVSGYGRMAGGGKVDVELTEGGTRTLTGKQIILATGSVCAEFGFIPMDHERIVNSDDILELDHIPKEMIVMGAGAVGTEFASVYNSFGTKVTIIELMEHLLPIEDHEISQELGKAFKKKGITSLTGHKIQKVERVGDRVKVAVADAEGKISNLEADIFLMAAGRKPVTWDIGADKTKVVVSERGTVEVDEFYRTAEPGVYAIGDIIATPWLAHVASHEAGVAVDHFQGKHVHTINYDHTPSCTYCHPEVASIGLTEREARKRGYDVKTGTFPFSANARARIMQEGEGMVKFVADAKYGEVLGLHIVGPKATELIVEGGMALALESTMDEIIHTMHAHPTLSETLGEAAHATAHGKALHI